MSECKCQVIICEKPSDYEYSHDALPPVPPIPPVPPVPRDFGNDAISFCCDCDQPEECPPPVFARLEHAGEITEPGSPDDFTFAGVAGVSVAVYAYSDVLVPKIVLLDPSLNNIGEDNGNDGYKPDFSTTYAASAVTVTLPTTGTYTVRVTRTAGTTTGPFTLIVSDGIEQTISGLQSADTSIYVASTQRIFVLSGYSSDTARMHVIDSTTDAAVATVDLQTGVPVFAIGQPTLFYRSTDDSVWVATRNSNPIAPDFFPNLFHRLDPTTGAILETFGFQNGVNFYAAYVPSVDKLFGQAASNSAVIKVFNCNTRAYEADITRSSSYFTTYCKYIEDLDRVVTFGSNTVYQLINPNDSTIGTAIATTINYNGFYLDGLYYTCKNNGTKDLRSVDLLTGTIAGQQIDDYTHTGMSYNPNSDRIMMGCTNGASPAAYLSVSLSTAFVVSDCVVMLRTSEFQETEFSHFTWNPDTCRMYGVLSGDPEVDSDETGNAYLMT